MSDFRTTEPSSSTRWRGLVLAALLPVLGCDPDLADTGTLGETAVVVLLNPPANTGNTAATPAAAGSQRAGVAITASPGGTATTDASGVAALRNLETGPLEIRLGTAAVELDIAQDGDVQDVALAYDGQTAAIYPGFPLIYPVGGQVVQVAPGVPLGTAPGQRNAVIMLDSGTHTGSVSVGGDDVVIYGQGLLGGGVTIAGDVEVSGTGVRLRGVTVTGNLTVTGDEFVLAHSTVRGQLRVDGASPTLLGNAICREPQLSGGGEVLYGNSGLDPATPAPAARCQ